ncbi:MAG TPA: efflux RND transporter periplasmic adaptor subunit, partial [Terriglobia bacterium]|nr:efflux RND transporter periplasmic adaptor subunit [Terriglobia bacterium]
VSKNELLSSIDGKKNQLKLDEAKRALAQLQQDIKSHAASNQASIAVNEEKRNKAKLAMEQAQQNIENMRVKTPISGLVRVRENQDAAGGFFFTGMSLPDYHEGDQVYPGSFVAEVLDTAEMELQAKLNEGDRGNLKQGQAVEVRVDALPGNVFAAKIKTVASMASSEMWGGDNTRRFDATFALDKSDARLRPGFTAHLTILGDAVKNVLVLPRQAIFEKEGKPIVYVRTGARFEAREVKIKYRTESRVAVDGLNEGTEVALVNPEEAAKKPQKSAGPLTPAAGVSP